jgi:hypothetical protein
MTTTSHSSEDLFHALAARARATSDGRLVIAVIGGSTAALSMAVLRPVGWLVIASLGVCAAAFGAWGIADRELAERGATNGPSVVVLRGARVFCVVLGTCGAIVAALDVLGAALGTWIS